MENKIGRLGCLNPFRIVGDFFKRREDEKRRVRWLKIDYSNEMLRTNKAIFLKTMEEQSKDKKFTINCKLRE